VIVDIEGDATWWDHPCAYLTVLAEERPDAFLPNLATSLNNQSLRLAALGRREEAQAAANEASRRFTE